VDGVTAAEVNLATEVATVRFDPQQVGLDELTAAVARAGYTATPRREAQPATGPAEVPDDHDDDHLTALGSGRSPSPSGSG
jgi:Cu+-exporting ATPase